MFSKRVKQVKNKARVNEDESGNLEALKNEIKRLKQELARTLVQTPSTWESPSKPQRSVLQSEQCKIVCDPSFELAGAGGRAHERFQIHQAGGDTEVLPRAKHRERGSSLAGTGEIPNGNQTTLGRLCAVLAPRAAAKVDH